MNSKVSVKEGVEGGGAKGKQERKYEDPVDSVMNSRVLVKEEVEGEGGKGEEKSKDEAAVDAEMNPEVSVMEEVEVEGRKGKEESKDESAADAEMNPEDSVKEEVEGGGGKGEQESEEAESSEDEEEDEKSSEASSSSGEESSEASSSSDEEGQTAKKHGGFGNIEALIEESELMAGIDDDEEEEEETLKGPIKSKHEVEVRPPVPKIEVQLEPHHKALPVGTVSAIMGERVIVEGSVQHNPLNEGSILWLTESRTPLGIVDELFGPVKNPYYLVRYNSVEEVPAGINAGTAVSFVMEFADHILNMKELYTKGYDESGDIVEDQTDNPEFSDDEKEAEYKRSLRLAKRQTDRQHESKKPSGDKKRKQPRGARFQKDVPPRIRDAPTPGHQSQHVFHSLNMAPATDNVAHSLGPQNCPMDVPTMMPPVSVNPAIPSAVQLANQNRGCFINPSQQFLQQPNVVWPGGLPSPYPNMGVNGAALAANIMQNILSGANQYQQHFHNQNFGGFPNGMPMPPPQFVPQSGMPANPMLFGGPPVNHPFGPASQLCMGQGNFGHLVHLASQQELPPGFPSAQECGRLPAPHGDGDQPPMQFNSRQLIQGNSSYSGRRSQQRGGRHSLGRDSGQHHK